MQEIEEIVSDYLSKLILKGEDDRNEGDEENNQIRNNERHICENLIRHQKEIIAVKDAIKPGFFAMLFEPFTQEMLTEYFKKLASQEPDE